ncbi:unnamed protein product [Brachionus calyciflorus]|uniref:Uncharacterized protein n=1 Tax=Brachionus calyciflorus TaxID=104777 RepID=A0A813P4K1_9BILA|nr:unnamed protein product [Brachionus calyciflorus]
MINRQVTDVKNIPNFTPQASLIFTPQTQPILNVTNVKQQPLITALNPQLSQMQPVYIIANNPGVPLYNPLMYPLNPAMQFNSAPLQYIYYPQTFRQNTNQIQIRPNLVPSLKQIEPVEKADAKPTSALKPLSQPPPPERPKTKEITLLYRYQKPITVDGLKHPNDKYKNLIYKPKFITSRNIEPLTEELVPKLDESAMTPIIDVKSRLNFTPVSTQRPKLVGDLKLPVEKQEPEKVSTTRLPVLVEDLKLPIEKSTPEPESKSEPEPVPQPQPIKEIPKFLTSSKISLSYNGKFHYPPEIDFNDATDFKDNFKYERLDDFNNYRPKSTIVNVLVEKDTFELAKILFNPNVIVEFNQLIETQNLSNEKTSRPKSSRIKENEEKKPKLNKVLKNVQEIHENYKMEQSSLNDNLRVPSRQSIKTTKHNENNQVNKRALSNAFQVNENVQNHEIKIEDNLRVQSPEKATVKESNFLKVKNRAKNFVVAYNESLILSEVKTEPLFIREKSLNLTSKVVDKIKVKKRVFFISKEIYENIKFESLNPLNNLDDQNIDKLKMKIKYKVVDPNETTKFLTRHVLLNANQIYLNNNNIEFNQISDDLSLNKMPSQKKLSISIHTETEKLKNQAFSNALQIMENIETNEAKNEPGLVRDKSQIATERVHSANFNKNLNEKVLYESHQIMENVKSEDILIENSNLRPQSTRLDLQEEKENFEDQSNEKFISQIPIRTDVENDEVDDAEDEVNIEQYERVIKQMSPQKKHDHHFHFHGGNRICCSAHRKHDPYYHIESKIKSFENFGYYPHHSNLNILSERTNYKKKFKNQTNFKNNEETLDKKTNNKNILLPPIKDNKTVQFDGYRNLVKYPDGSIRIFSQNLQWTESSKIGQISFENIDYKNHQNNFEIFSEKLNWNKESKIKAISDLDLSQLNTQRSSQLLIFHELPKWKDLVDSKVKSFENFHYRPSESRLKIYDEKIRWNSESRLKPLLISQHDFSSKSQSKFYTHRDLIQHRPDWFPGDKQETFNAYYRTNFNENFRPVINEKTNWNVQSRLKAISWENFNYNSQNKKKKQSDLKNKIKPIPEKKTIESQKSSKKKIDLAEIWSKEYNRIKQENKQKRNQLIKQSSKTPRITNMETPDLNKISSRQSFSKYKELPPIKSGKENNFDQQLNLEQRIDTPWNLNSSSQRSFSRMFNPELNNQSQKRLKYDSELKRRSVDQIHHNSTLSQYQDEERNQSQFGTELINDLRLPRITSPNRKSTPDTSRLISNLQTPSGLNTTFDQQSVIQERQIKKRSKQSKESISSRGKESRLSKQHEPQLDGFQLSGSTLKIDGNAKVRPLANMSYKNAEDKAKIRATSRLYSSLMTPRSYYSNDTAMNYFN